LILYGRNPVREALRSSRREVRRVWATEAAQRSEEWLAEAGELHTADAAWIEERAGSAEHQGICAEAGGYPYADPGRLLADEQALVVALDEVQDPHNLGAVCRVAESVGAAGVVIPERRAAEVTPATAKASAGAVEHLAVARVRNLADWLAEAKEVGAWVYGADAGRDAVPYDQPDYRGRVVLVLGSEGRGLRPRVAGACDQLVALPQLGHLESLNVSTAAAALLYGILQFRA
jgi:23S rRNA (guanosine2251-2'-O)-methyltransferase